MARTKKKLIFKAGPIEISKRVQLAEPSKPKKPKLKGGQGAVVGVAGNTGIYGYADTGEYLRKLDGPAGRQIFDEMRRSDPQVKSVLKAINLPIRRAQYFVEPASDQSKDVEIAETIENGLLRGMTMAWDDTIRHILLMLPFGFSILEKIWEYRDSLIMPRKLDPRLPQSVERWEYDRDKKKLIGPVQRDVDGRQITLPIEKILVFTSEKEGDNWEGISILRAVYKPWYIKDDLEKINAIKHDRHGVGIPKVQVPAGTQKESKEWATAEELGENLRAMEQGYIVHPETYDVSILGSGTNAKGTDTLPSIRYYDEKTAQAMLAMFIYLGTTQSGNRALGSSFIGLFLEALQAYADYIVEVLNRFLIKEWVGYNWSVKEYPQLKVSNIKSLDTETIAELAKAGVISPDDDVEGAVREELHLPEKKEEEALEQPAQDDDKEVPEDIPEEVPEEEKEDLAAREHHQGWRFANREFTEEEKLCDIPGMELQLDEAQRDLSEQLLEMKRRQQQDIIMQLVAGRRIQDIRIILKKDMYDLLFKTFKQQVKQGKKQVAQEITNQTQHAAFADPPIDYDEYLQFMAEQLSIDVEGAGNKLKAMLAGIALELKKLGYRGDRLRQELLRQGEEKISGKTWEVLSSGAVNQGWGAGRDLEMQKYKADIDYVYRSAILDGNACHVCIQKDGTQHELNDRSFIAPDPECEGTDKRCRCLNIAVMKQESQPEGVFDAA